MYASKRAKDNNKKGKRGEKAVVNALFSFEDRLLEPFTVHSDFEKYNRSRGKGVDVLVGNQAMEIKYINSWFTKDFVQKHMTNRFKNIPSYFEKIVVLIGSLILFTKEQLEEILRQHGVRLIFIPCGKRITSKIRSAIRDSIYGIFLRAKRYLLKLARRSYNKSSNSNLGIYDNVISVSESKNSVGSVSMINDNNSLINNVYTNNKDITTKVINKINNINNITNKNTTKKRRGLG